MDEITFAYMPCTETEDGEGMAQLWEQVVAEAKQAEAYGFDAFQLTEHHQQPTGTWPSLLTVLAGVAQETETLELGSCVHLLPLYHPVRVAEQVAMIDIISNGRLTEYSVGAGYAPDDFAAFNIPLVNRQSLMEEGLTLLPRLWTEDEVHHYGKRYEVSGVSVEPKPIQEPRPPIYSGAWTGEGVKRAARLADGWVTAGLSRRDNLQTLLNTYADTCEHVGKDPRVSMSREAWVGETREKAEAQWSEYVMHPYRYYFSQGGFDEEAEPWLEEIDSAADLPFDKVSEGRFIVGSPEDCIEEIEQYNETLGATHFILRFRYKEGPSHEETMETIKMFGEEVISHFKE